MSEVLLHPGEKVRVLELEVTGLCVGFARDTRGDEAAEMAYVDKMGIIHTIILKTTLFHVWRYGPSGGNWFKVTGSHK